MNEVLLIGLPQEIQLYILISELVIKSVIVVGWSYWSVPFDDQHWMKLSNCSHSSSSQKQFVA